LEPLSGQEVTALIATLIDADEGRARETLFELTRQFDRNPETFIPDDILETLSRLPACPELIQLFGVVIGIRPELVNDWAALCQLLQDELSVSRDVELVLDFMVDAKWHANLSELYMSISLPPEFLVITRDTVHGAEALEANSIDTVALQSGFISAGIYLNAMPPDFHCEYVISSHKTAESERIGDFAGYGDSELEEIISAGDLAAQFRLGGLDVTAGPVSRINDRPYYTLDFDQGAEAAEDGSVYSRQFFTIVNGRAVNIIYNKWNEPITEEDAEQQDTIINRIVFSETDKS
jgi:hypothetical protein